MRARKSLTFPHTLPSKNFPLRSPTHTHIQVRRARAFQRGAFPAPRKRASLAPIRVHRTGRKRRRGAALAEETKRRPARHDCPPGRKSFSARLIMRVTRFRGDESPSTPDVCFDPPRASRPFFASPGSRAPAFLLS